MFTDMVGYSALSQRDDKLALELLEEHRQLLREIFPRFNGTEIKTIGDAFLVEFNSALEAAQCAIAIQRALAKRDADAPAERQIQVRIGIHIGDVVHRGGDVYGDGVNIASRIEPLADAGGICVSMDVERQIRNSLEARFEKLAPTELKNISVAMDLFRIVLPWEKTSEVSPDTSRGRPLAASQQSDPPKDGLAGARIRKSSGIPKGKAALVGGCLLLLVVGIGWWWTTRPHKTLTPRQDASAARTEAATTTAIPEKSIAVLPFENLSGDPNNAYFAEGMQDEILARLSKIADLKVISRTSTQKYKSAPDNLREIAKQLGVANILEGSVQKTGDQVRVNVQLINALKDAHLWADIFDRKLTDIFAVKSDIAKTIADTLQARLTGTEKEMIAAKPTSDTAAYELYLKGRSLWRQRTGDNIPKAIAFYEQAVARDPNYALAYAGLAEAYVIMPVYTAVRPRDAYAAAKTEVLKALQLNDKLAEAHTTLALLLCLNDFDMAGSVSEFQRAIALNPNDATAHQWFGEPTLTALGRFDDAIAEEKRAIELEPLSPNNNTDLGWILIMARRYDDAIAQLHKAVEIDPTFYYAHVILGVALQAKGELAEAMAEYMKAQQLGDLESRPLLALAKAQAGDKSAAVQMLAELDELSHHRYARAYFRALLCLNLGKRDEAIRWLEQSVTDAGPDNPYLRVHPFLDPLRGDPRFEALAEKIVPAREFKGATVSK